MLFEAKKSRGPAANAGLLADLKDQRPYVLVSQLGSFHGRFGAQAAHEMGALQKFVATVPTESGIPAGRVHNLNYLTLPGRAFGKAGRMTGMRFFSSLGESLTRMVPPLFIRLARNAIDKDTRIFHVYSAYQEPCWEECDRRGVRKFIDWGIAHPAYYTAALAEECDMHGFREETGATYDRILQELYQADRVLVPSPFVYDSFKEAGHLADNLVLNPYGVDVEYFYVTVPYAMRTGFRIVTSAGFTARKGLIYLLEAVRLLKKDGLAVDLQVLAFPNELEGTPLVRYRDLMDMIWGFPFTAMPRVYNEASVFVLPSLVEGMSRAVLEAMACGLPVVVTPNCGYRGIVRHGDNGFEVPIRDPEAIANCLRTLFENRDLAVSMSARARETAEQNTWLGYKRRLQEEYARWSGRRQTA